ncbi:uncharacterized protein LY89DRAFT_226921 [Mollisia scopiformis]|uniref:Uncharacterized protein n=1 Tax=Mollisia scopiformis TaxID=149040 RepID=A0A194WVB3_MOLSC|nr:uncharacterized protein LY89DRAFT_226921 [Mollisia scopiformis]KUJ11532.1 hypothetical protein LY89DRAFT_226921 [Mollisia scopiformis]
MGGGPENPMKMEMDGVVTPLNERVTTLTINDDQATAMSVGDNKEGVLDGADTDSEIDVMDVVEHKQELMRELKALGVKPLLKPDYTKPLDEPSWGDEDDEEEDDDVDMEGEGEGVLDGEDEEEGDEGLEDGELEELRSGK